MDIKLAHCNSIEKGRINIRHNALNIKYAINGTGKTTIAKAIELFIKDKNQSTNNLVNLKPFKHRENKDINNPKVEGLDSINEIAIFNEDYINQYVFVPGELIKDSFDIFIRDEKYEQGIAQINQLIKVIGEAFEDNQDIEILLKDLRELSDCFGKSKGLSKASSIAKGLGGGNKVENIPEGLEVYEEFIRHDENVKWLQWQMNGNNYIDISSQCPYCISDIEEKKETILAVKDEYDSKLIEHLNKVIGVVHRLSSYFTRETYENIKEISQSVDGIKKEQENYLLEIRVQIDTLIHKLLEIRNLNFHRLKDFDKTMEFIDNLKIDLMYIDHLNSDPTSQKVNLINNSLDEILTQAGKLQGEVNKQKRHIETTIKEYSVEINEFLRYAGYDYYVEIKGDEQQSYKLTLKHKDFVSTSVENPKIHLSFGERNAFALVLFMFDVVKRNPDLIILDDPISSFDKNKKFATINMLFKGKKSLSNRTVLMLTHDFDPIVDIILHLPHRFCAPQASYLENIDGIITEKNIFKKDIKTYLEIAKDNIENLDEDINKLIYLRRLLEIENNKTAPYQLLSNLFKKREFPLYKENGEDRFMTEAEIGQATDYIAGYVHDFTYKNSYNLIVNQENLITLYREATNNYEKLQIYRLINLENSSSDVVRKFVNETFHIENDYLYQLNPCEYQTVPQYIIEECDKDICKIIGVESLL